MASIIDVVRGSDTRPSQYNEALNRALEGADANVDYNYSMLEWLYQQSQPTRDRLMTEVIPRSDLSCKIKTNLSNNADSWFSCIRGQSDAIIQTDYMVYNVEGFMSSPKFTHPVDLKVTSRWHYANGAASVIAESSRVMKLDYFFQISTEDVQKALYNLEHSGNASVPPRVWDGLETQVLADLKSPTWDVGTELAELPETLSWLKDKSTELRRVLKRERTNSDRIHQLGAGMKRKGFSSYGMANGTVKIRKDGYKGSQKGDRPPSSVTAPIKGASNELASRWMEYRYAVMPIVYSIESVLDLLHHSNVAFYRSRKRADDTWDWEDRDDKFSCSRHDAMEARVFGKLRLRQNSVTARAYKKIQFWLPLTLWEKIPLSFVVDWGIGVGDYLQSLRPLPSNAETAIQRSRRQTTVDHIFAHTFSDGYQAKYWFYPAYFLESFPPSERIVPLQHVNNTYEITGDVVWYNYSITGGGSIPVYQRVLNSYERLVPTGGNGSLSFRNGMTVKRAADAAALSFFFLKK